MSKTVILGTARTPFGKMGGGLSSLEAPDLGAKAIESALDRSEVQPDQVQAVMRANPGMRQVNRDWGERVPTAHFVLDQDRLRLIGLSPTEVAQQLQFLLTGVTVTQVR